jgi:hypothetical protein
MGEERTIWLVIGHVTPTDDEPDPAVQGQLDEGVSVVMADSEEEAESALLWVQDGIVRTINVV